MDYKTAMCIPRMCEYMYRKGVYDASLDGDVDSIREFSERNTAYHKPRFLTDFCSRELKRNQYSDYVQMVCSTIGALSLRHYLAYKVGVDRLKRYVLILADYYYREGLREWDGETQYEATEYLESIGRGQTHMRKGVRRDTNEFFDEIKYRLTDIEYSSESGKSGLNPSTLSKAMGRAVLDHKVRSCK